MNTYHRDLRERESALLSSRNIPVSYTSFDCHEDPDVAERLHQLPASAFVTTTTGPHQPSRLDPVLAWLNHELETVPAWFRTFLRCLRTAVLIFIAAYLLLSVYVWIAAL